MKILVLSHVLSAGLYLTFFIFLTTLLFARKRDLFDRVREKVKIPRMILEFFLLGTGIALLTQSAYTGDTWLWAKIALVAISIGIGVVGMKKKSIFFMVVATMILVYVYGVAETKSLTMKPKSKQVQERIDSETKKNEDSSNPVDQAAIESKSLYMTYCVQCHGEDGAMGFSSAKNLQETVLTDSEISVLISKGKGVMPGFPYLKDAEKGKIISYLRGFRK